MRGHLQMRWGLQLTSHVKSNHRDLGVLIVTRDGVPDDPASRARQNSFQPRELFHVYEAAIALHKLAACAFTSSFVQYAPRAKPAGEAFLEARNVLLDGRREVGIGTDTCCSRHQLDHGHKFMA